MTSYRTRKKLDKKANRTNRTNTFAIHLNTIVTVLIALALIVSGAIAARAVLMAPVAAPQETAETGTGVQGGAFEVTSYDLNAVVNSDHSYNVEEKISVSIPDQIQSIEFAIPSGNFRMSDLVVEDALYQAKTASEASTVVISDQDKLTKGDHVYTIKYTIYEYRDFDDSKDMFYFDVLLPEWKQPVSKVNINVSFPDDFPWDDMQCYAGQFGVQDSDNKISFDADEKAHTVTVTGSLIPENYGITLKAQLPDGYWKKPLDGSWSITAITLIMAITSLALLVLWLIGGRDPKIKRKAVTKPIEGLEPVEIGYAFNSEVRRSDVLHMIIRFAQKGYLRISEYEPKRYRLYKGNDPAGEECRKRNPDLPAVIPDRKDWNEDLQQNRAL